ncbi:hypothetical protein RRV45_08100 [Bacillus sp. DTU_2020_1000418_1_SI_GHA_SEK_038]|uniref:hypothetical protein n=1 Tax=Bacillus sp. DTU_2020_1000418_1_SI_GHA_SEK_038 TaxID=3077585 RepID=UPI0028EFAAC4|nr:hypothetical protein [Bacillus sp. DTU_2020_1000418_1_SI_GHA_SEK_038]WNS76931.1 hypothetical protein RRV45_08100 [Bacillus sp. DTU_2020_1000418_1_SI_GHA_SEK_038]
MRKLSEYDHSFQELKHIPRSNQQKQLSLLKILDEMNKQTKGTKNLFPQILTISVSFAACVLFAFIVFHQKDLIQTTSLLNTIENNSITQMTLSPAKSNHTFTQKEGGNQKGIYFIEDDDWNLTFNKFIKNAQNVSYEPQTMPLYDLLLTFKNHETIKIKVWAEDGLVYLKELEQENFYLLSRENSAVFIDKVNSIHEYIETPLK